MNLFQRLLGRSEGPKRETRQTGYTDAFITALLSAATGGTVASTLNTAAVEAAAGLLGRAFAGAKVTPQNAVTENLTPHVLNLIGRDLMRRGESLWSIEVSEGALQFSPAGTWNIEGHGATRESEWWYRLDLFGPSDSTSIYLPSASVLHFRYAVDASRPWLGVSPLGWASTTARLQAEAERSLADEAAGPVAQLLAIPTDGGDGEAEDALALLKKGITRARGKALLLETVAAGWGDGQSAAPHKDWIANRLGPNPPTALNTTRRESFGAVLAAMGSPPDMFDVDSAGTAQRESFRRWYSSTAEPLARIVEAELSAKLETDISLDLTHLYAHDLVGRASAFQRLVSAGVSVDEALATSGLLSPEMESDGE